MFCMAFYQSLWTAPVKIISILYEFVTLYLCGFVLIMKQQEFVAFLHKWTNISLVHFWEYNFFLQYFCDISAFIIPSQHSHILFNIKAAIKKYIQSMLCLHISTFKLLSINMFPSSAKFSTMCHILDQILSNATSRGSIKLSDETRLEHVIMMIWKHYIFCWPLSYTFYVENVHHPTCTWLLFVHSRNCHW